MKLYEHTLDSPSDIIYMLQRFEWNVFYNILRSATFYLKQVTISYIPKTLVDIECILPNTTSFIYKYKQYFYEPHLPAIKQVPKLQYKTADRGKYRPTTGNGALQEFK